MNKVTRALLVALAVLVCTAPAWAQTKRNVTFQVDMTAAIDAGAFTVGTDSVLIRGSMNDWGTTIKLSDPNSDKIYTTTLQLDEGTTYNYKFWASVTNIPDNNYEDGENRSYTVTSAPDQTVPVVAFRKTFASAKASYEVEFVVDMSVARLGPKFNPATDVVVVAGSFNGWNTTADTLVQDFINPNLYSKVIELRDQGVPSDVFYKFVIGKPGDTSPQGWEGGSNRELKLTGNEPDTDNNGLLDLSTRNASGAAPYYDRVTPDQILTAPATVRFEVDLRPAFYYLKDNGQLPSDTQTGETVPALNFLAMNGPAAGAGDGLTDWATWGPNDLGQIQSRILRDDGQGPDAVARDTIYTIEFTYQPGTSKRLVGKFGTDGYDNEGGVGADHVFFIEPGTQTIRNVFGAVRREDGTFDDDRGPTNPPGSPGNYDPYILISPDGRSVQAVRRGGLNDGSFGVAVEPIAGELPEAVTLGANYPNPFNPTTTFEYTLRTSERVRVRVFDLTGRAVATLVDGVQPASTYRVTFDARGLASGVYVYQLETPSQVLSRKMLLLK